MNVDLTVRMQISLDEEGVGDPAPRDPLETRMLDAVKEAAGNALTFIEENAGYEHEMATIASIGFAGVLRCRRADDTMLKARDGSEVMSLGTALEIVHAMARNLYRSHGEFCSPANNPADVEEALDVVEDFIVNHHGEEDVS